MLIRSQNRALEMIVTGAPLESVLDHLARTVEIQAYHQAVASILLLKDDGTLQNGASPNLPDAYIQAINGLRAAVDIGTCCSAAATGQIVITTDIETDPGWATLKRLPLGLGLQAAWSQPILGSEGEVLGTFGTYFRERRGPTMREKQAVGMLARTAALAIECARTAATLRNTQSRLEKLSGRLEHLVQERTEALVQSQARLRELATELNLAEQRERTRLATELHDHLQQLLVLGKLKLGQGKGLAKAIPPLANIMQQTDDLLTDSLAYTRSLVADLSPSVLREHGLVAGLKWLAEWMQRHDLTVVMESELEAVPLPPEQAVLLFQSARELLINSAKHAQCQHAWLKITYDDGCLCITVRDEGAGFECVTAVEQSTGRSSKFGLFSIRERMKALGGSLDIDTAPGRGTTSVLRLPLIGKADVPSTYSGSRQETTRGAGPHAHEVGTIGVVLVDDHAMIREGLRAVLANFPDIVLMGEAADGEEAVMLVRQVQPSVVVMDINMPKLNGIQATARIKAQFPYIVVIGLSVNADSENQDAMKRAGAARLLTKEAAVNELYRAICADLKESERQGLDMATLGTVVT